jgi:lysozyme
MSGTMTEEDRGALIMLATEIAAALVKPSENCELKAYLDVAGIATIGWGMTRYPDGRAVSMGDEINQDDADNDLAIILGDTVSSTLSVLTWDGLNEHMLGACSSLAYNIGATAFCTSTLVRRLNRGSVQEAAAQFLVWDKAHVDGQLVEVRGLLLRRQREQAEFLTGLTVPGELPASTPEPA